MSSVLWLLEMDNSIVAGSVVVRLECPVNDRIVLEVCALFELNEECLGRLDLFEAK